MFKSLLYVLMVLAMCASLFAKTAIDKNFHQKYDVKEGANLRLDSGDGNVEVITWSQDVVDIDIVYRATFSGMTRIAPKDFEAEFVKRGDQITVVGREPRAIGIGSHRVHEYKYTIKAPAYLTLDIRGVDGAIVIRERRGDIKVQSVDGDIEILDVTASLIDVESVDGNVNLDGIDAKIRAETVDGTISIRDITTPSCYSKTVDGTIGISRGNGSFEARSVDGNIEYRELSAGVVKAHTSDGRIDMDIENAAELDASLRSGDGDVRVKLVRGASVTIHVDTGDGRIRTDLSPVSDLETDDNFFRGSINGGTGSLTIRTGDGNVNIVEE